MPGEEKKQLESLAIKESAYANMIQINTKIKPIDKFVNLSEQVN